MEKPGQVSVEINSNAQKTKAALSRGFVLHLFGDPKAPDPEIGRGDSRNSDEVIHTSPATPYPHFE